MTKILTPPQAEPILEIARELLPPGMELVVADPGKPEFYDKAGDAEYYLGSPRTGIGNEFFRAAPRLKLVQLTSAGYDRVDIEAARKAKVPVANNGGANSIAVAEHAVMLMLAVQKKLVYHHLNVVSGTWRASDFASSALLCSFSMRSGASSKSRRAASSVRWTVWSAKGPISKRRPAAFHAAWSRAATE